MLSDLRHAFRGLRRHPGFTAVAVLTLALGIGGITAIFTLVDAVMLKPLPVRAPERLALLEAVNEQGRANNLSYPFFEQLRDESGIFDGVFAASDGTHDVEIAGAGPDSPWGTAKLALVSGSYFEVLGVVADAGQTFGRPEEQREAPARMRVVLSHAFAKRRFGGDRAVVGRTLRIHEQSVIVAGVAPQGFFGEAVGSSPDLWAPIVAQPAFFRGDSYLDEDGLGWLRVFGRLRSGMTLAEAGAGLDAFVGRTRKAGMKLPPRVSVTDGRRGVSQFREQFAWPLRILSTVVGLVLLIACANVSNLLLARATTRRQEIAIRLAMGSGRRRVVRQFFAEGLLIAALGSAAGILVAMWGSRILLALASTGSTPISVDVTPDIRVLAFAIAAGLVSVLLFGLAPAWLAARVDMYAALRSTGSSPSRALLPRVIVVGQFAICLALLTTAGLFIRTLTNLQRRDLGFETEHLATVRIMTEGYKPRMVPELMRRVLDRVAAVPGVEAVTSGRAIVASRLGTTCCIAVEGYVPAADENREVRLTDAGPGFFETLRLPIHQGRALLPEDRSNDPRHQPVKYVVNEAFVRRYLASVNPVGRRFGWGDPPDVRYENEIVGVAADALHEDPRQAPEPVIYSPSLGGLTVVARTRPEPAGVLPAIRKAIDEIDPRLVLSMRTMSDAIDAAVVRETVLAQLAGFFGLLAVGLAAIGLYGVMGYTVARRTKEIGIRMALGAAGRAVLGAELRSALWLVAAGVAVGLPAVLIGRALISSQLFGVSPTDPLTIAAAVVALLATAMLAALIPARRAARVDPVSTLRAD
jgi:predicted permease